MALEPENVTHIKKIFIISGEVSGDVLGAKIMHEMPGIEFVGVGGQHMRDEGLKPIFSMADLAVMGVSEVVARARTLTSRIKQTVDAIISEKPDIVLTIDSPGFAKSVVSRVRKSGQLKNTKFYHVVAPQVWAWRPGRAKKYAKIFDKLYAFFDFEIPYFTKYGLPVVAVGHPISDGLDKYKADAKSKEKIIALVPGSRMSEVKKLLPLFQKTVEMLVNSGYRDYKFVIPTVETTEEYVREHIKKWKTKPELIPASERYQLYANTYIAIVASGTVSAELAIMHIPTIVVYKMNRLTVLLAKMVLRVQWASLVNILMNKSIFPELLGAKATVSNILDAFQKLTLPSVRNDMLKDLKIADKKWNKSGEKPAVRIAHDILKSN